jgi:hypothetical protein
LEGWNNSNLGTALTHQNYIHREVKSRLNARNASYHSVQNILSSSLISTNIKTKIHRSIILSVLYECEIWSLRLREKHRLGVFETRILRKKFGPKRKKKVKGEWREQGALGSVLLTKCSSGDQITKNEVGEACSMYGEEETCIQGFGGEMKGKETTWKT